MRYNFNTDRLTLSKLEVDDAFFIYELVNSDGWLRFIGDRNVKNTTDAKDYVQRIKDNQNVIYWVVRTIIENVPVGIITLIKRDYLEYSDIGFAFLPEYMGKGYAYEAALAVLNGIANDLSYTHVSAITVGDNINSIKLLEKLGFRPNREIVQDGEVLMLYAR